MSFFDERYRYNESGYQPPDGGLTLTRRQLLAVVLGSAGTTLAGVWLGNKLAGVNNTQEKVSDGLGVSEIADDIRKREAYLGNRPLTIGDALTLALMVTDFYTRASHSPLTMKDLASRLIIIRPPVGEDKDWTTNDYTTQFKADYPQVQLSPKRLEQTINSSLVDPGWVSEEGYVFLSLKELNTIVAKGLEGQEIEGPYRLQFTGDGRIVSCRPLTPAVKLRSVLIHEYTHFDLERNSYPRPIDNELVEALKTKGHLYGEFENPVQENFTITSDHIGTLESGSIFTSSFTNLSEFVVDALASRISRVYGMPYALAYGVPNDFINFENILKQANMSYEDLAYMFRRGELKEFLLRIGQSAQDITFSSQAEVLNFSLSFFNFKDYPPAPQWSNLPLQKYFPGVDTTLHFYGNPEKQPQGTKLGCK